MDSAAIGGIAGACALVLAGLICFCKGSYANYIVNQRRRRAKKVLVLIDPVVPLQLVHRTVLPPKNGSGSVTTSLTK
jgi:hypothetical protein